MNWVNILGFVLARVREPSTWAGLATIATTLGAHPEHVAAAGQIVAALAGVAAVLMPEKPQA